MNRVLNARRGSISFILMMLVAFLPVNGLAAQERGTVGIMAGPAFYTGAIATEAYLTGELVLNRLQFGPVSVRPLAIGGYHRYSDDRVDSTGFPLLGGIKGVYVSPTNTRIRAFVAVVGGVQITRLSGDLENGVEQQQYPLVVLPHGGLTYRLGTRMDLGVWTALKTVGYSGGVERSVLFGPIFVYRIGIHSVED